jgi:hypothetical protein
MDHARATRSRIVPVRPAAALALALGVTLTAIAPAARAEQVTEVTIERVKPRKDEHPTLQFLKENRDFIRARFDLLREKTRTRKADGAEIDPRFLAYQKMMGDIHTARDSMVVASGQQQRLELFASITQLGAVESRLDVMERLLDEQRARLGVLQTDFTGDQQTALLVVVTGFPTGATLSAIDLALDDRPALTVPLTPEQCATLQRGGSVEVFHGFVEPREQVLKLSITGDRWTAGDVGYATLDPTRDRLTLLRLDLTGLDAGRGATSIQASTWLHSAGTPSGDR